MGFEYFERILYQAEYPGEKSQNIVIERRKSNYYLFSKRSHMRIEGPQYKPPSVLKETEEKERD